jgi:hypothetical protein
MLPSLDKEGEGTRPMLTSAGPMRILGCIDAALNRKTQQ